MIEAIKKAAQDAIEASGPVAILFGVVTKSNPLEVSVDQRFSLDADFLIVPESLRRYEVDLRHSHVTADGATEVALPDPIVIRNGLEPGDKVILLRMQGGQNYIILDRVVSG